MPHIVVDDQQAKLISETTESVEIRDPQGKHLGFVVRGLTVEDTAIAKQLQASDGARISRPKTGQTDAEATMDDTFPLAEEVRTYEAHVPEWLDREGQWVLIKGRDVLGFYLRYEAALEAGYQRFGAGPFLVQQILRSEPIYGVPNVSL
jgi:hypothetical protein